MTCIIGFVCRETNKVYIGGDSAGIAGHSVCIRADHKVFHNGPFLVGFTSSYRMGQLLRYTFAPPHQSECQSDMEYMVNTFVPAIKACFKEGGFQKNNDGQDKGGFFLVGYRGNLYEIENDYQVGICVDDIICIGSGAEMAIGAMYGLSKVSDPLPPKDRITKALEIVTYLNTDVRPPFVVEEC